MSSPSKIFVFYAENGQNLEFDCDGSTLVESLQRAIQKIFLLPPNDQILLCHDRKLEPHRDLSFYKLPQNDTEIFLFNRARVFPDSPPPNPEKIPSFNFSDKNLNFSSRNAHFHDPERVQSLKVSNFSSRDSHFHDSEKNQSLKVSNFSSRDAHFHDPEKNQSLKVSNFSSGDAHFHDSEKNQSLKSSNFSSRDAHFHDPEKIQSFKVSDQNLSSSRNAHYLGQEKIQSFKVSDQNLNFSARDAQFFDESPDPALKALPSYERQFRIHFQRGNIVFAVTQMKFEACRRFLMEMWVQQRAMETARGSLEPGYRIIQTHFSDFIKDYSLKNRYHYELLQGFSATVERLRGCVLHPALQSEGRKCLLDFVKEENLRKVAENCSGSHRQFEVKVSQLKSCCGDLKRRMEDLGLDGVFNWIKDLESMIKDHQKFLSEQKCIMQSLSKDVNTVKKLVDDCLSHHVSPSLRPHDAVSALGPMYDVHEKSHLPQLQACDAAVDNLLAVATARKNDTSLFVHRFMQKIFAVQAVIRDVRLQFPVFTEALDRQSDLFHDLSILRGIAPAYRACLAEVIRRRSAMKLYMGKAGEYAENLARDRELEITRRGEFLRTHVRFVPREVMMAMGLFDSPTPCEVNVAPFDTNLLDIDFQELERFAPEQAARGSVSVVSERPNVDDEIRVSGTSKLEVENARLRAELAAAIARICSMSMMKVGDDESELLRDAAEKTEKAMVLKDEFAEHLRSALRMKEAQCCSYEKRIEELEQRLAESYREARGDSKAESECKSGVSGNGEVNMPEASAGEAMEEAESKVKQSREGIDESMVDFSDPGKNLVESEVKATRVEDLETELKTAMDQIISLQVDLETSRKVLEESQMNCAHLENCLHEARQDAQTNLCAADRRASEYNSLRSSAVKMRGLFERLRCCVAASGSIAVFVDSLQALSISLASCSKDEEDEGLREFRVCIRVLAEKVSFLSRQRGELLDRCSALESTNGKLSKEVAEKKELVKSLYSKLQLEKQGSKEKISFGRLEVHELAAFVLNSAGHYVAINRSQSNYYLSTESVALFVDHLPAKPAYITGQIVHIERQVVKIVSDSGGHADVISSDSAAAANPYGLRPGCEYYIVTVAMLPDSILSQTS